MGKILVLYDSMTGNTSAMAQYVAEGAQQVPGIEMRKVLAGKATIDDAVLGGGHRMRIANLHRTGFLEDEEVLG